jgi:hypothetical protein
MTIMLGTIYAALEGAGAPHDEARAAAEEVGDLHDQFGGFRDAMHDMRADLKRELSGLRGDVSALRSDFRGCLDELRSDFRGELAGVRSDVAYLRGRFDVLIRAVGINAAATIAILGVLLRH